ncbi:MAG: hypothetical protein ACFFD5_16945 [Candidatus Thorarchaeota archaeon]
MKISLLQPEIIRGDINHNVKKIQQLINISNGELLILPEYPLTGSLVLDRKANIHEWSEKSKIAKKDIKVPENKVLILNTLKKENNNYYNICELLPTDKFQIKVFPDDTERNYGIIPGKSHEIFNLFGKKFKILICMDFKYVEKILTDNVDFFIWIYHFTKENYLRMLSLLKNFVKKRTVPVLASSLVSDKNCGFSTFIDDKKVISLSNLEGLLEIEL